MVPVSMCVSLNLNISSDNPHPLLYSGYKIPILGQCVCTVRLTRLSNIHFENSVFIMLLAEHRGVDLCA